MKKCLQCNQIYDDDTNFCLSDGTTLVSASNVTSPNTEIPTIVSNTPFVPPYSKSSVNNSENSALMYILIGLLALIIGGGIVGGVVYFLTKSDEKSNSNTNVSNENSKKDELAEEKERLKAQQDKLDEEKKRLENERKNLEAKKNATPLPTQTQTTTNSTTATVFAPPSNVRESPGGAILCSIKKRTTINIQGSTGVYDNNGVWYYTDVCGRQGVIHSTQIRF